MNTQPKTNYTIDTKGNLPRIELGTLKPSTATANELSCAIIDSVLSGYVNPLDLPVKKKCIEQALDAALKNTGVQSAIIEEINKHGKSASHLGAKLEVMEAGVRYDYSNCNDSELMRLEADLLAATNAVKLRQQFLKSLPAEGQTIVSQLTGEVETIYPPTKSSTTTIKTTML